MTKGIYLPTNQNTIILNEVGEYCEILLGVNLKQCRDEKIADLEEQKRVSSRFEILGIIGIKNT